MEIGRYPYRFYGRVVGTNSILCTGCGKWSHRRCSGLRNVNLAGNRREEKTVEVGGRW